MCSARQLKIVNKSIATNHPLHLAYVVTMTFKFMLLSPAGHKSSCMFLTLEIAIQYCILNWRRKWQPTPMFLPGESQGWGSLVGCRLWGRTESDTTEVT